MRVEIVDEIGGQTSTDAEGNDNGIRFDAADLSLGVHSSKFFSFRLRKSVVQPVYLRIYMANVMTDEQSLYLDEMVVVEGTELYEGGPYVAAVGGRTANVIEDAWDITVSNNRAGQFQTHFNRSFDMAAKGLLLPSSGSNLVADTLIA